MTPDRNPAGQIAPVDIPCSIDARADDALVLIVRTDGRVVDQAAGDPAALWRDLGDRSVPGEFLHALWPDKVAAAVVARIRSAVRRRTVSALDVTLGESSCARAHEITVLPHGRDRALLICRDVTGRASLDREVRELAFRDAMTRLPNRAAFLRQLGKSLDGARLAGRSLSLLRVQLRGLDYVNRTFGRHCGSRLVATMAQRLAQGLEGVDGLSRHLAADVRVVLARTEGNEYTLLVDGTADTQSIEAVASGVVETLSRPEALGGDDVTLDICVGIARFPQDADDVESLTANAGVALYEARKQTSSAVQFFSGTAQVRSLSRMDIARELRWALDKDQFDLAYQPWFDSATGRLMGAEALLRWEHPLRGSVPLAEILPIAQMNDLSDALGYWVLERAVRDMAAFDPSVDWPVAVNLFARHSFSTRLVQRAQSLVQDYGVEPSRLQFEIRAADFYRDLTTCENTARALAEAGFSVTLDDCGLQPISPRSLLRTGIRQVKLGRELIKRLPDEAVRRVVAAYLGMMAPLEVALCATGVENAAQRACLSELGCPQMQGFLLGRPESIDRIVHWGESGTEAVA